MTGWSELTTSPFHEFKLHFVVSGIDVLLQLTARKILIEAIGTRSHGRVSKDSSGRFQARLVQSRHAYYCIWPPRIRTDSIAIAFLNSLACTAATMYRTGNAFTSNTTDFEHGTRYETSVKERGRQHTSTEE